MCKAMKAVAHSFSWMHHHLKLAFRFPIPILPWQACAWNCVNQKSQEIHLQLPGGTVFWNDFDVFCNLQNWFWYVFIKLLTQFLHWTWYLGHGFWGMVLGRLSNLSGSFAATRVATEIRRWRRWLVTRVAKAVAWQRLYSRTTPAGGQHGDYLTYWITCGWSNCKNPISDFLCVPACSSHFARNSHIFRFFRLHLSYHAPHHKSSDGLHRMPAPAALRHGLADGAVDHTAVAKILASGGLGNGGGWRQDGEKWQERCGLQESMLNFPDYSTMFYSNSCEDDCDQWTWFLYCGYLHGCPKITISTSFPKRHDVSWQQVLIRKPTCWPEEVLVHPGLGSLAWHPTCHVWINSHQFHHYMSLYPPI